MVIDDPESKGISFIRKPDQTDQGFRVLIQKAVAELTRALVQKNQVMDFLGIPHITKPEFDMMSDWIKVSDLYEIVMDEDKCKVLISKLRNKALW